MKLEAGGSRGRTRKYKGRVLARAVYVVGFKFSTVVDCQTIASKMTDCNTNGMNFNEGNNEQPCVPDAHGFSSLTVNSSQKGRK